MGRPNDIEEKSLAAWLLSWAVNSFALILASIALPGVDLERIPLALLAAIVLSVATFLIEPVLYLLTLPINVATFGIFTIVLNGIILIIVSKVVPGFSFSGSFMGLGWAVLTSVIISIFRIILHNILINIRRTGKNE